MVNIKHEGVRDFVNLINSPSDIVSSLTLDQWNLIICQARSSGMLGRLYNILRSENVIDAVPEGPLRHLRWGSVISRRHEQLVNIEVESISRVLSKLKGRIILLKGAAYCYGRLNALKGRIFTDIDLLMEEQEISSAETLLERNGWLSSHMSKYDQRYYRRWMHELPPMKHGQRQTELDLHHAILPRTSRFKTDTSLLLSGAVLLNEEKRLYRLSDQDLLLHSAAHLFFDGEFKHGFRDLEDIRSILLSWQLSEFGWRSLLTRAAVLDLSHPLYFSLYFSKVWFSIEVPPWVLDKASSNAGLGIIRKHFLIALFSQSLLPVHRSCASSVNFISRYCLYVRSHYIRMPMMLLVPHLIYKACVPLIDRCKDVGRRNVKGGILERLAVSNNNGNPN